MPGRIVYAPPMAACESGDCEDRPTLERYAVGTMWLCLACGTTWTLHEDAETGLIAWRVIPQEVTPSPEETA